MILEATIVQIFPRYQQEYHPKNLGRLLKQLLRFPDIRHWNLRFQHDKVHFVDHCSFEQNDFSMNLTHMFPCKATILTIRFRNYRIFEFQISFVLPCHNSIFLYIIFYIKYIKFYPYHFLCIVLISFGYFCKQYPTGDSSTILSTLTSHISTSTYPTKSQMWLHYFVL